MALSQTTVMKLYSTVIDDVIAGVRDAFLDEGVDEQVLQEMKQIWTNKLMASKAVEAAADPPEPQPPPAGGTTKANGTKLTKAARNAAAAAKELEAAQQNGIPSNLALTNSGPASLVNGTSKKQQNMVASSIPPPLQPQQQQQIPTTQAQQETQSSSHVQQQSTQQQTQPPPQLPPPPPPAVAGLDPNKIVPIQITLPAQVGVAGNEQPRVLTIHVPASALQENQLHQMLTGPVITSIMPLPVHIASNILQQHVNAALQNQAMISNSITIQKQLDGANDTSDEDGSDVSDDNLDGDDDDDIDKDDDEEVDGEGGAEEEPLNSEDDVTDEDPSDLFDTDNVVVCQYDKITRSRNKWKFYLKDGIMNIGGKDYVFQKSNGDAEW